jgi:transcriptional regulator with XRE-family HTH domain
MECGVLDGKVRDDELLSKLGKWIAIIRKETRLSRQQLADATGMSLMAITYIENGQRWPRISNLEKIAKVLEVSVGDLFRPFEPKR